MYSVAADKRVGAGFIPISADLSCEILFGMYLEYRISNVEPQNYEVVTSTFDISCSTCPPLPRKRVESPGIMVGDGRRVFCGSEKVLTKLMEIGCLNPL